MSIKVAVSDLHNRLDYLIGFSSQLVFVGNDDLHFQQNTLQSFIAQQHENVEVALLRGEQNRSAEDYRKEICRQILHRITGQFDVSLRNVLNDFDGVENPVLICLCASQHLPKKVLEELWELVLLARTSNNKHNVNVILFGESKWVVEAKKVLAIDHGIEPVLLSTELGNSGTNLSESQQLSDLETLLANKRAAFAERIQERSSVNSSKENEQTLIQTTRFKIGIGLVFLVTFAAFVLWFYPPHTSSVTSTENSISLKPEDQVQVNLTAEIPEFILDELDTIETIGTIESPEDSESSKLKPESPTEAKGDQLFVTQWESTKSAESNVVPETITEELTAPTASLSIPAPTTPKNTLEMVQSGKFLVQIASAANLQRAEQFISKNSLQESTWIYTTNRYGGSWHVVLINKSFQSNSEARNYITTLSEQIQKSSPFVKSIEQIRKEIAIAN